MLRRKKKTRRGRRKKRRRVLSLSMRFSLSVKKKWLIIKTTRKSKKKR